MSIRIRWAAALTVLSAVVALAAPANAATGAVVATWQVAPGVYEMHAGLGAMWAVNADEFHDMTLYRIDPTDDSIDTVASLPFPAGGMTTAYGSVWVTDYFGNAVWRLAPDGHVQATVRTGLQPQSVIAAFGSIWTSNHHGWSLSRIDPMTNTVVATVPVGQQRRFRNGPQVLTHDATHVYVGSSNLFKLQSVDPADNSVFTPSRRAGDDQFCGDLVAVGGWVWNLDNCSGALYQLGTDGSVHAVYDGGSSVLRSATVLDHSLWVSEDQDPTTFSHGALVQRDPRTGAVLRFVAVGGDASTVRSGFGDLWVFDGSHHTIRRVDV